LNNVESSASRVEGGKDSREGYLGHDLTLGGEASHEVEAVFRRIDVRVTSAYANTRLGGDARTKGVAIEVSRFHRDVRESRAQANAFARRLFAHLPERYDRLASLLSLGQDRRWRTAMIDAVVASRPGVVLDVACGPASVTRQLIRRSSAHVVGLDVSPDMLRRGRANVIADGAEQRASFVLARGERLPFPDASFDALTFTYLLRYVSDPEATLAELARVVRPGGAIASLEFAVPPTRWWHAWWWLYTRMVLPIAGGLTGGRAWWRVGRFLGPSISAHYRRYPLEWTQAAWSRAGVNAVVVRRMSLGGGVVISGVRAS